MREVCVTYKDKLFNFYENRLVPRVFSFSRCRVICGIGKVPDINGRIVEPGEQWRSGWEWIVSRFLKIWNLRNTGITWFKKGFLIMTIWMSLKPRKQGKPELNFFYERCYLREHEKLKYLWCLWAFISHICTSYFRETYQKPYKDNKVIISSLATVLKSFSWRVHVLKCLLRFSWTTRTAFVV